WGWLRPLPSPAKQRSMVAATDAGDGCSRRQYLIGACGVVGAIAAPGLLSEPASAARGRLGDAGFGRARISPDGHRVLAESERIQQQQGNELQFDQRVDAVDDLGCDPNGSAPVQDTLNSKIEDGMLVVFPPGTYAASGAINPSANRFGIVGKGYQKASRPPNLGQGAVTFKVQASQPFKLFNLGPIEQGLFGNFVIDQRNGAMAGVTVRSSGNVRVCDVRTVGGQT